MTSYYYLWIEDGEAVLASKTVNLEELCGGQRGGWADQLGSEEPDERWRASAVHQRTQPF